MIPHVCRQEVYAGQVKDTMYEDKTLSERQQANVSPVNFFVPNTIKYKHIKSAAKNKVDLETGDCVFMPAYYYYQLIGFSTMESKKNNQPAGSFKAVFPKMYDSFTLDSINDETYHTDELTTAVSLKFQGNS